VKIRFPPLPLWERAGVRGIQHLFHLHPHLNPLSLPVAISINGEEIKSFMKIFNITKGHFALQLRGHYGFAMAV